MDQRPVGDSQLSEKFLLLFNPEHWSATNKFLHFMGSPYTANRELAIGTRAAQGHHEKFLVLAGIADRLQGTLTDDLAELEQGRYTPAARSREFAAITETLICELYSCLDGIRRVLYSAYKNVQGIQNHSTERLFIRTHKNAYGPGLPVEIQGRLAASYQTWFPQLHRIRTELTHGDVGSCHLQPNGNVITYMHPSLGTPSQALVINDIVSEVNGFARSVSELMESIFGYLYAKLDPVERRLACGFYRGRLYERYVPPAPNLTFASGRCFSRTWFESEEVGKCPIRLRCGAYSSNEPEQEDRCKP